MDIVNFTQIPNIMEFCNIMNNCTDSGVSANEIAFYPSVSFFALSMVLNFVQMYLYKNKKVNQQNEPTIEITKTDVENPIAQ